MIEKRYQFFVSSTYEDLREERQHVIQSLLALNCMPAGMELFPAADDDQWTLIKDVIDECDYYIVVVGGRYGSCGEDGMSYTEKEYRYALKRGKPIIGFLHSNPQNIPSGKTEETPEGRAKLAAFRELVRKKTVSFWENPADLATAVTRGVVNLTRSKPGTGWIKADSLAEDDLRRQVVSLTDKLKEAQMQIADMRKGNSAISENLETEPPVQTTEREIEKSNGSLQSPTRRWLPATRPALNHMFDVAGHEGVVSVGLYEDGRPGELSISLSKEGSTVGGFLDVIGIQTSLLLQFGVPLELLVRKFAHIRFEPAGMTSNRDIPFAKSLIDYVFRWLGITFLEDYRKVNLPNRPSKQEAKDPGKA